MSNVTLKTFFGFMRHPFPAVCPPTPLFRSERIDGALAAIRAGLQHRMHALLVAPPGFGKSCLLRLLVAEMNPREFTVVSLVGMPLSVTEWIQRVGEKFGIETAARRGHAVKLIRGGLEKSRPHPVLVFDEAHRVPVEAVELLRSLSEEGDRPILSMLLCGDESLARILSKQAHTALAQRVASRVELKRPGEDECAAWIEHSFRVAGMNNILSPSSVAGVFAATGGVPREMGRVLAKAMELALAKRSQILSDEIVQEVLDGTRVYV